MNRSTADTCCGCAEWEHAFVVAEAEIDRMLRDLKTQLACAHEVWEQRAKQIARGMSTVREAHATGSAADMIAELKDENERLKKAARTARAEGWAEGWACNGNGSFDKLLAEARDAGWREGSACANLTTQRIRELAVRAWHSFRSGGLTQANGMAYCLGDDDIAELKQMADEMEGRGEE